MSKSPDEAFASVLEAIGRTPLVRLGRLAEGIRTPVFLKLESLNPGGSVKDRIGVAIVDAAERDGSLRPGGTIVEGTAGNTGVALAMVAAVRGYHCVFTMPDKMSAEKVKLLEAYGAEVVIVPTVPPDHPEYYGTVAQRIVEERQGAVLADQFYNPANPAAHEATTGPEIWEQTGGAVTHFVASAGTGGTITGAGRYLKRRNPGIRIVAGDPKGSVYTAYHRTGVLNGGERYMVEGVGSERIPGTFDVEVIDEFRTVDDGTAFRMARRLAREEGMLAGGSTGLIVHVALEVAAETDDPEACVVALFCDTGERYLSKLYDDAWMKENGFL